MNFNKSATKLKFVKFSDVIDQWFEKGLGPFYQTLADSGDGGSHGSCLDIVNRQLADVPNRIAASPDPAFIDFGGDTEPEPDLGEYLVLAATNPALKEWVADFAKSAETLLPGSAPLLLAAFDAALAAAPAVDVNAPGASLQPFAAVYAAQSGKQPAGPASTFK